MSPYQYVLPETFPFLLEVRILGELPELIKVLSPDEKAPRGSSFAVTVDCPRNGFVYLWLSSVSMDRITKAQPLLSMNAERSKDHAWRE